MRIGLFGGTFDPVHLGHLILAEACREACSLDQVLFIVAGEPPHKGHPRTSAKHRHEMVELAIAGNAGFEVSDIEMTRPGPHYSFETLQLIQQQRPDDELFFLVGADSLADLPGWRYPERICQMASLIVVNRPGTEPATISGFQAPEGAKPVYHVTMPDVGIASRMIRAKLAEARSVRYLVPRAVEMYLTHHHLYDSSKSEIPTNPGSGFQA